MPISPSDIAYLYSGGPGNTDPDLSLGGEVSVQPIVGNVIFDIVTPDQAASGYTDYRCVYISNDSMTDSFYNAEILIASQVAGGASIELGFDQANDRQTTTITKFSNVTGGTITLDYIDTSTNTFTISWNASVVVMAASYQAQLQAIPYLGDVTVTGSYDGGTDTASFEVNFVGTSANRYQQPIVVNSNSLTYTGPAPVVANTKIVDGSPINSVAVTIDVETTPPTGVSFSSGGFTIGEFRSMDVVPVWLKRTVPAGAPAQENDGFVLRLLGTFFST